MSEQRYLAVLAVIPDGDTVTEVAARFGVSRKTLHVWLSRYEAGGLENLMDRSHRPRSCLHQMPSAVEVALAELRRAHPGWGPKRLVFELRRRGVDPVPSEAGVYRALVRLDLIDPAARRPRDRKWKRWERGTPMEVLFDRICRENAITHRLTQPRSPTTTGKIERFHRSLRSECRTDRVFASIAVLQAELDEWVEDYNTNRPHQAIAMDTPVQRFQRDGLAVVTPLRAVASARPDPARRDGVWVARRASKVGVVCVNWQQVCLGVAAAGCNIDVWVTNEVMQFLDGDQLLRTEQRTTTGEVRKKRASVPGGRATM